MNGVTLLSYRYPYASANGGLCFPKVKANNLAIYCEGTGMSNIKADLRAYNGNTQSFYYHSMTLKKDLGTAVAVLSNVTLDSFNIEVTTAGGVRQVMAIFNDVEMIDD